LRANILKRIVAAALFIFAHLVYDNVRSLVRN
jgi:hypothetical protein